LGHFSASSDHPPITVRNARLQLGPTKLRSDAISGSLQGATVFRKICPRGDQVYARVTPFVSR
jgi:hypothetical protein